jgi:hypothetical protein
MNVTATQTSLERFLEAKRAAEQRMQQPAAGKSPAAAAGAKVSFLDIIKSVRKKDDNTRMEPSVPVKSRPAAAPVAVKAGAPAEGLLAVYDVNRFLSKNLSENEARTALLRTQHLGKLFDAVA